MTRHIWIPQHFTEAQADALMSTFEKDPDLAQKWLEALPAPAPAEGKRSDRPLLPDAVVEAWLSGAPAPSKEKRGRKPTAVDKDTLGRWLLSQGFEWNVRLKQASVEARRAMILAVFETWNVRLEQTPVEGRREMIQKLPQPIGAYFKDLDPYVLNNDRKEIRDRLADLAQELWGDPLVAKGRPVDESTGSDLDETTAWLLGQK